MAGVSEEDFCAFMEAKAYDVISDGAFKRHLIKSRDAGEAWAVSMHTRVGRVAAATRAVQGLVAGLSGAHHAALAGACRDVMASAQPPVRVFTGYSRCWLTGAHTDHSIDLTRNGKHPVECHVHPRFWHFFVFLWFVAKVEYVARACTKQWGEQRREAGAHDYTALCEAFTADNRGLVEQLHRVFVKAVDYVQRSLAVYREEAEVQPVLRPPPSFFLAGL